jgi:serine protease AprX
VRALVAPDWRNSKRVLVAFVAALLIALSLYSSPQSQQQVSRLVSVIVQATSSDVATDAVESVGGEVTLELPIVSGVAARVPESAFDELTATAGVRHVSRDFKVNFHGAFDGTKTAHQLTSVTNASRLWENGIDGSGTTVAVLDTGIYEHPDLADRIVGCVDFSHEAGGPANCTDTFGHGTFMAGLIAGNGASSGGKYKGSAPGANLVNIKVAGFDGATDVSHVLAGIQWAVAFKDTYGIDVLNLSLGTDSSQDYRLSPLNYAVERAWNSGIAVVVSSGNTGPNASTVMKPGDDPFVITVGSTNHQGTVSVIDDTVPVFSGRGPTRANGFAKPDVVAPGVHTVSLRSPGSAIDQKFGSTATVDGSYFKGTGTSMSTASVSGLVAQMLQANPSLTPDQVKYRLMETARDIAETDATKVGTGLVDAVAATTSDLSGSANQGLDPATGLGSLLLDRSSLQVDAQTQIGPVMLTGEFVAQIDPDLSDPLNPGDLVTFNATSWHDIGWDATSWHATSWHENSWAATSWHATSWHATSWHATSWHGTEWANVDWDATSWHATSWHEMDWDATSWHATSWHSKWYAAAWD